MALNFEKFASEGNAYLNTLSQELKLTDKEKTGRILEAVLHAVRNRITPEESVQLISQFPMFLKAVYVDGWSLSKKGERIKHLKDFFGEVRKEGGVSGNFDFETDEDAKLAVKAVFVTLRKYVSEGEIKDIAGQLPEELKSLVLERVLVEKNDKATSI